MTKKFNGAASIPAARGLSVRRWIWGKIPPGFKTVKDGWRRRMLVRADLEKSLSSEIFSHANGASSLSSRAGRARLRSVKVADENILIRTYHHGGLLQSFTGEIFFTWPPRPFRELAITEELRRRGVPTVIACGACVEPVWGPFYKGWLMTRELEGSEDLWNAVTGNFVRDVGADHLWRAAAAAVRHLHREGVYHSDLNLKNVLVRREDDDVKAYVIDFDKAMLFFGAVPPRIAEKNLKRLLRSVRKLDPERTYVSERDWKQFIDCYFNIAE